MFLDWRGVSRLQMHCAISIYFHNYPLLGIVLEKNRKFSRKAWAKHRTSPCKLMFFWGGIYFNVWSFFLLPSLPVQTKEDASHPVARSCSSSSVSSSFKKSTHTCCHMCVLLILCHSLRNPALLDVVCMFSGPGTWLHFVSHDESFSTEVVLHPLKK